MAGIIFTHPERPPVCGFKKQPLINIRTKSSPIPQQLQDRFKMGKEYAARADSQLHYGIYQMAPRAGESESMQGISGNYDYKR